MLPFSVRFIKRVRIIFSEASDGYMACLGGEQSHFPKVISHLPFEFLSISIYSLLSCAF